jgi:hypothetical protein
MASILCNGCDIIIDGSGVVNGSYTTGYFLKNYYIYGNGNGVFSGVSNYPLVSINLYYTRADDGLCKAVTGRVYNTGTNPNSGWSANSLTGCTGTIGCTSRLLFNVVPSPALFNQFPGSTFGFSVTNYTNSNWTGIVISGSSGTYNVQLGTVVQDCGTISWYAVDARWTAPIGLSGFMYGTTGHRTECTYCSSYEVVALP